MLSYWKSTKSRSTRKLWSWLALDSRLVWTVHHEPWFSQRLNFVDNWLSWNHVQGGSKTFELKTFEIFPRKSKTFEISEVHDFAPDAKTFEIFCIKHDIQKLSRLLQAEFPIILFYNREALHFFIKVQCSDKTLCRLVPREKRSYRSLYCVLLCHIVILILRWDVR